MYILYIYMFIYTRFILLSKKKETEKKEGDIDEDIWDLLLSADKKDYERICFEHGITDFRGMLKKLQEMKREREEEQAKVYFKGDIR